MVKALPEGNVIDFITTKCESSCEIHSKALFIKCNLVTETRKFLDTSTEK